jgi:hypothetical protein
MTLGAENVGHQGLKPASFAALSGTAEAVPFPKPHEPGFSVGYKAVPFPQPLMRQTLVTANLCLSAIN